MVGEGDDVGTVLVVIGDDGAEPAPRREETKVRATPLIRKIAQELGVDLESIHGTDPQGRIQSRTFAVPPARQKGVANRCAACAV